MKYSLCFPYVQFHGNCTTCNFVSYNASHVFFFFPMASLQGSILYLMCVFLKKKKRDDYICVLSVPLSGSVGWTCLSAAIFLRPGFLLALLLVMKTHWKHCLLAWRVTKQPINILLMFYMINKCSSDNR